MVCRRRGLLVLISWIWMLVGAFLTSVLIFFLVEGSLAIDARSIFGLLYERPYLASYIELVALGGLPLAISLICGDDFGAYGLRKDGALKSLALAVTLALFLLIVRVVNSSGVAYEHFGLSFPLNVIYASLAVIVYGPLEVFFVIWLIVNTDRAIGWDRGIFTPGLLITVVVFGLSHLIL